MLALNDYAHGCASRPRGVKNRFWGGVKNSIFGVTRKCGMSRMAFVVLGPEKKAMRDIRRILEGAWPCPLSFLGEVFRSTVRGALDFWCIFGGGPGLFAGWEYTKFISTTQEKARP